jgi:hypothetical protein
MTRDPRAQERERIKNIGEPVGFTFFAEPTPSEARYLGNPDDVSAIVRDFCVATYEIRSKVTQATLTGDEALAQLEALAHRYAGIFYGKEPGQYRSMPFNSPQMLGDFIVKRLGLEEPLEQAGYVLFMNTANQILEAYAGHQSGAMDDETVQFRTEAAIEDTTGILLGLPPEE